MKRQQRAPEEPASELAALADAACDGPVAEDVGAEESRAEVLWLEGIFSTMGGHEMPHITRSRKKINLGLLEPLHMSNHLQSPIFFETT